MAQPQKITSYPPTRIVIAAVFILVEVAFVFTLLYTMTHNAIWVYTVMQIISIVIVAVIVNRRGNPSYKLTWIIFILTIPPMGGVIYLLWGGGRALRNVKKRMRAERARTQNILRQDPGTVNRLNYYDNQHARQSVFLQKESGFPVWDNTKAEYLSPGEKMFPRLLEELQKAQKYIFLEFFILAEGEMWDSICQILRQKVAAGVEVRVLYDDFGSMTRQSRHFAKNLKAWGIHVSVFNPIKPPLDLFLNNRNHRKIVVIDGITAFTGGINVGDEYINRIDRHGYWMDCAALFQGQGVTAFATMFCQMWNCINPKNRLEAQTYLADTREIFGEGFVQPYADDPFDQHNAGEGLYMQMLCSAKRYVYITSPYLVLDNSMVQLLCTTAKAGIDVRIITPKKWDKWYVHPVTQYHYDELLQAGVRIFEFTPGFIHSKMFISDDRVATIGTVNMDYRSFYLHFECGAWMCGNKAVLDMRDHFLRIQEDAQEILYHQWHRRHWQKKLGQFLLHLFAPFM